MSKQRIRPKLPRNGAAPRANGHGVPSRVFTVDEPLQTGTFVPLRGAAVTIGSVPIWMVDGLQEDLRAAWLEAGRGQLDPPTYTVDTVGGEQETHVHDDTTTKTPEEQAAYDEYQANAAVFANEHREHMMRILFVQGVLSDPPADGQWVERQKFFGRRVPDDPQARKYHWVKTEIVRGPNDATKLMNAIMSLSGVSEEALRIAEKSFRGEVEKPSGDETGGPGVEAGELVPQPVIPGSEGGESLGHDAE